MIPGEPNIDNPYNERRSRRDFMRFVGFGVAAAAAFNLPDVFGSQGGDPNALPAGDPSTSVAESAPVMGPVLPDVTIGSAIPSTTTTTTEAAPVVTDASVVTESTAEDTTIPEPSTTDTEATTPPTPEVAVTPEFKVNHKYYPGDPIGNMTVIPATPKADFPTSWILYYTDNPTDGNQQIPLQPNADYYGPYIEKGGPGLAGDSLFLGEKVAKGPDGQPLSDPTHRNRDSEIFGHRTTHGGPFRHIDELSEGDIITFTYFAQDDDPELGGKQFAYVVLGPPGYVDVPKDTKGQQAAKAAIIAVPIFHENVITMYACHPPGSKAQRVVVKAELVEDPAKLNELFALAA